MRILAPFWYLDFFHGSSHLLPLKCISEQLGKSDEFHIAYIEGKTKEWEKYFLFHKLSMPAYDFIRSRTIQWYFSMKQFYTQIQSVEIDILYAVSGFWSQEFSRYYSNKKKTPYVVRLRGDHRKTRDFIVTNPLKKRILNYFESRSLKDAELVIPLSRKLAREAERWGVDKERITEPVYNGVDTQMFKPMSVERSNEFTVAYAGRLSPEKRITRFLKIAKKLDNCHFIIAGKKQMDVCFHGNVEYLGELRYSEMPKFYNKADLVVLPSFTEGFPGTILEAYACGKPVIATKDAFPEELKIFGSAIGINEFESEIKKLMKSNLKAIGQKARSHVQKHYTWKKFGLSMVSYMKKLAK